MFLNKGLFLSLLVLSAHGCCPSVLLIPFVSHPDKEGAAWTWPEQDIQTSYTAGWLHVIFSYPASKGWAGFGIPLTRSWSCVDLSKQKSAALIFRMRGSGIDQLRITLKGPGDVPRANESQYLLVSAYYDKAAEKVRIPLAKFAGHELPWDSARQIIIGTDHPTEPIDIQIKFPLVVGVPGAPDSSGGCAASGTESQEPSAQAAHVIPDRALLQALLNYRLSRITSQGRPLADPVDSRLFQRGQGDDGFATVSETVAYYLKVLVLAVETRLLSTAEGEQHFKRVWKWAKAKMMIRNIGVVYDLDSKGKRSLSSYPGEKLDPKVASRNPSCLAWRYIPRLGIPYSTNHSLNSIHSATDAELEIASALILASKVLGDAAYLQDARDLARCIKNTLVREMDTPQGRLFILTAGTSHKEMYEPGKGGPAGINPSYFLFSDLALLAKTFDQEKEFDGLFEKVRSSSWTLLDRAISAISPKAGLPPNWAQAIANKQDDLQVDKMSWKVADTWEEVSAYGFDALRTPLRLRMARQDGVDVEKVRRFWNTWGECGARTLIARKSGDGQWPSVISADGSRDLKGMKNHPSFLLAARVWFLEAGYKQESADVLKQLLDGDAGAPALVRCADTGKRWEAGCKMARFHPAEWDYYPSMLTLITGLQDLARQSR